MSTRIRLLLATVLLCFPAQARSQQAKAPDAEPILRIDTGGPVSFVTALEFSPNGQRLYAAGWDKVIRVWQRDDAQNAFVSRVEHSFRVPIGPGLQGAVNALASSPDGRWLAVAGKGSMRGSAGFHSPGRILPGRGNLTDAMRRDEGTIYLFDTREQTVRQLRGPLGPVLALGFAPAAGPEVLACAAQEWDPRQSKFIGTLRLWEVESARYVGGTTLPEPTARPQLTVLRTGKQANDVRVAVAMNDGKLRVWDVWRGTKTHTLDDGQFNSAACLEPATGELMTAGLRDRSGMIQWWQVQSQADPRPDPNRRITFPSTAERLFLPRQLALVRRAANGPRDLPPADLLAVALLVFERRADSQWVPAQMELRLVSLDNDTFGRTVAQRDLWSSEQSTRLPVMAAAADGQRLAIAGGPEHEVQVFAVADLLGNAATPQRLRSLATTFDKVAFVRRDDQRGLRLTATRPGNDPADESAVVLALGDGRLVAPDELLLWKDDTALSRDWSIQVVPPPAASGADAARRWSVRVTGVDGASRTIRMEEGQEVTATALAWHRGAQAPNDKPTPLLAVASHDRGQPRLALYNAGTGHQIRQLTGHTERIRGLAFSADVRFLVSCGEDQTARVWTLVDLDDVLGKRGGLAGVVVQRAGESLEVVEVDNEQADETTARLLRVGDRLVGFLKEGQTQAWKNEQEFYDTWWRLPVGSRLAVRRVRQTAEQQIALTATQGIDERKPLFSLLLTRPVNANGEDKGGEAGAGEAGDVRRWIGWSPLGPFESSDRQVERYLGWQFNTWEPAAPTMFAQLAQYRDRYYRRGLLGELVAAGRFLPPPPPAPLDRPQMSLSLLGLEVGPGQEAAPGPKAGEARGADGGPAALARTAVSEAMLSVDFEFPRGRVASATLQLNDDPPFAMTLAADNQWRGTFPDGALPRGRHTLRSRLLTRETTPQQFDELLELRVVPPSPQVRLMVPANRTTREATAALRAQAGPSSPGEALRVELRRVEPMPPQVVRQWEGAEPVEVDLPLELQPGTNVFELVAWNARATDESRELETARQRLVVIRDRQPIAPPTIVLHKLVTSDGEQPLQPAASIQVRDAHPRLVGGVESTETLTVAEILVGDAAEGRALRGFTAGEAKTLEIDEPIELRPGPQLLRFRAKSAESQLAEIPLRFDYRPRLPRITITSPVDGRQWLVRDPQPQVTLVAQLQPADNQHPFEAQVLVNDAPLAEPPEIDPEAGTLKATVALKLGANRIQVRLRNAWQTEATTPAVVVSYLPAPKIVDVQVPAEVEQPFMDVRVQGQSDGAVEGCFLEGRRLPETAYDVEQTAPDFRLTLKHLPLDGRRESSQLRLLAAGSPTPAIVELVHPRLVQPPVELADVEFLDPQRDLTLTRGDLRVRFAARSQTILRRVELFLNGQSAFRAPAAAAGQGDAPVSPLDALAKELLKAVPLTLRPGPNFLTLEAENDGGVQSASLVITNLAPPVRLLVDGLAPMDDPDALSRPSFGQDGTLQWPMAVGQNRLWLQGRVHWSSLDDPRRTDPSQRIQIWVNGFQQRPANLEPAGEDPVLRTFRTPIVLNRTRGNVVELRLPGLEQDADGRATLRVDCDAPLSLQRLHLLVLGVGVAQDDEQQLVDKAIMALRGERLAASEFTAPGFGIGKVYGPLTGSVVTKARIVTQLLRINRTIAELQKMVAANDVVLIYYQGGELVSKGGQFYLTTRQAEDRQSLVELLDPENLRLFAVSGDLLARFVEDGQGAHVLLFDVLHRRPRAPLSDSWPSDSHAAMLRFAWLREAAVPSEARLLSALESTLPQSPQLGDVESGLRLRHTEISRNFPDSISYERFVPVELRGLSLLPR